MSEVALKYDGEKPRMDLVPAGAVIETAKVFTFGAKKYAAHNWRKGFDYSRLIASLERHIAAFKECEDTDPESGLMHMAHASCCVMMLIEHQLKGYGTDDRYREQSVVKEEKNLKHFYSDQYPVYYEMSRDQEYIIINGEKYYCPDKDRKYWTNKPNYHIYGEYRGEGIYKTIFSGSSFVEISPTW